MGWGISAAAQWRPANSIDHFSLHHLDTPAILKHKAEWPTQKHR